MTERIEARITEADAVRIASPKNRDNRSTNTTNVTRGICHRKEEYYEHITAPKYGASHRHYRATTYSGIVCTRLYEASG